jgi:hypothetical protein
MLSQAVEKIAAQQGKERTAVWMVGEQLKDICRHEPKSAELIMQDLDNPELSIANAEKKIKAYADKHKTGNFACVMPAEADKILREFYGLPALGAQPVAPAPIQAVTTAAPMIDLASFLS